MFGRRRQGLEEIVAKSQAEGYKVLMDFQDKLINTLIDALGTAVDRTRVLREENNALRNKIAQVERLIRYTLDYDQRVVYVDALQEALREGDASD